MAGRNVESLDTEIKIATMTENILHNVINGRVLTAITVQNELKDATIYMNVDPRIRQSAPKRDGDVQ